LDSLTLELKRKGLTRDSFD